MKHLFFVLLVSFVPSVSFSSPVKSMLAANETENIVAESIPLPDGVTAVEYIESTGTQYIATGVEYTPTSAFDIKFKHDKQGSTYQTLCMIRNTGSPTAKGYFGFQFRGWGGFSGTVQKGSYAASFANANVFDNWRRIVMTSAAAEILDEAGNVLETKDLSAGTMPGYGSGLTLILFAQITWNGYYYIAPTYFGVCKVSQAKFYDGDTLVLDLIPVRIDDEDGNPVGAMYDYVSESLFFNNGTGAFIIGPDLPK